MMKMIREDKVFAACLVSLAWFIVATAWLGWDTFTGNPKDFPSVSAYVWVASFVWVVVIKTWWQTLPPPWERK